MHSSRPAFCLQLLIWTITACPYVLLAQNAGSERIDTGAQQMLSSPDKLFAMNAAQDGLAEVQLGKMATEKASNPQLKAFGQQMIDDHTRANDGLTSVAQRENMTLPSTLNAKDQAALDRLGQLSGAAFDKAYATHMLKDHEIDVKAFAREADKGQDPPLKNFASQTLPVLQAHLEKLRSIATTLPAPPK